MLAEARARAWREPPGSALRVVLLEVGCGGTVRTVRHQSEALAEELRCKLVSLDSSKLFDRVPVFTAGSAQSAVLNSWRHEIAVLTHIGHANIVRYFGAPGQQGSLHRISQTHSVPTNTCKRGATSLCHHTHAPSALGRSPRAPNPRGEKLGLNQYLF